MRRSSRPAALALALAACGPALEPPRAARPPGRAQATLRIATWNVHELFDADDRALPPGSEDEVLAPEAVEAKLAAVAAVLARLELDVVVVEEVETAALAAALAARAGFAEAWLVDGNDARGLDVAVLSRVPIVRRVSHAGERDGAGRLLWPRDCVEAHLELGGRRVAIVASHLSSRLSDDGTRRAAQATRMREIADAIARADPAALVVVGGDLNDPPGAPALAPLAGDGAWADPLPGTATTWGTGAGAERLDALLVPRPDARAVLDAWVDAAPDVLRASDHQPVVVELRLD